MARSNFGWRYLFCQLIGWSLPFMSEGLVPTHVPPQYFSIASITGLAGLISTHLLRIYIIRRNLVQQPRKKIFPTLLLGIPVISGIAASIRYLLLKGLDATEIISYDRDFSPAFFFANILVFSSLVSTWVIIYFSYHYIRRMDEQHRQRRRLEVRLREMQQDAETSVVNVESLLHSLTRIQTLIEENPARSRAEITEFSNLLRKGYLG